MKNSESQASRKERLLERLDSLSPEARKAMLEAGLELRQEKIEALGESYNPRQSLRRQMENLNK